MSVKKMYSFQIKFSKSEFWRIYTFQRSSKSENHIFKSWSPSVCLLSTFEVWYSPFVSYVNINGKFIRRLSKHFLYRSHKKILICHPMGKISCKWNLAYLTCSKCNKIKILLKVWKEKQRKWTSQLIRVKLNICNLGHTLTHPSISKFERVNSFRYIGCVSHSDSFASPEVRRRVMAVNRCFYDIRKFLKSDNIKRDTKLLLYRSL